MEQYIPQILCFSSGVILGWFLHIWWSHNPVHIAQAETTVKTVAVDEFEAAKNTINKAKDLVTSIEAKPTHVATPVVTPTELPK